MLITQKHRWAKYIHLWGDAAGGGKQPKRGSSKYGRPSPRRRGWREFRCLLEPCGFLLLRLVSENDPESRRRKGKSKRQKKVRRGGGVGSYCSRAQTWHCDCSQRLWSVQKRGKGGTLALMVYTVFTYQEADVSAQEKVEFTWWNTAPAFSWWHSWGSRSWLGNYCLSLYVWGHICNWNRFVLRYCRSTTNTNDAKGLQVGLWCEESWTFSLWKMICES